MPEIVGYCLSHLNVAYNVESNQRVDELVLCWTNRAESRIENKNTLLGALNELPVSTFAVAKIEHAFEVLLSSPIDLVFCEEHVTDGSYRELLSAMHASNKMTPFVLILCTGKWEECLEAMRLGVTDVLQCPLEPSDINLTLVRTMRDKNYANSAFHERPGSALGTLAPEYAGGIGELRMLIRRPTAERAG